MVVMSREADTLRGGGMEWAASAESGCTVHAAAVSKQTFMIMVVSDDTALFIIGIKYQGCVYCPLESARS